MCCFQSRGKKSPNPLEGRPVASHVAAWIFGLLGAATGISFGADLELHGQLSFRLAGHDRPLAEGAAGIRYIPSFSLKKDLGIISIELDAPIPEALFSRASLRK